MNEDLEIISLLASVIVVPMPYFSCTKLHLKLALLWKSPLVAVEIFGHCCFCMELKYKGEEVDWGGLGSHWESRRTSVGIGLVPT